MLALSIMLPLLLVGQTQPTTRGPITYEDLHKLAFVFDPEISPDGSSVAYILGKVNFEQDRRESEVLLYDVGTGSTRVLIHNQRGANSPRWSPDGKSFAFCALGSDRTEQLFTSPIAGGDVAQITHSKTDVESYSWSPDGKWFAFTAEEERTEPIGTAKYNRSFEVANDPYLTSGAPIPLRLWVVSASGGALRPLGQEGRPLQEMLPPATPTCAPQWSRDSKYVFVVSQQSPSYGDAWWTNRIERISIQNGKMMPVTNSSGFELSVSSSPTEDCIAYWAQTNTKSQINHLFLSEVPPGENLPSRPGRDLSTRFDVNEFLSVWMPDGKSILTGGNTGDTVGLWTLNLKGNSHRLDLGDLVPSNSFGLDASVSRTGAIAFAAASPRSPSELYYMASTDSKPVAITHANGWVADIPLGETRTINWKSDSFTADGIVTLPPNFDPHRRFPLVVQLHGGPQDAAHRGYSIQSQFLAGQGFVVFEPNYRGSDNLGEKYMQAIWNDAGDGPSRDVMGGLKRLEAEPWIDPSKESLLGWSYGGFMAAWLMGHDHRWKSAVCGAAILDWTAMRTQSDFGPMVELGFKGKLWKNGLAREYAEQSPISYAGKITTPTLILADTGDQRVPTTQSFELFHALREKGIPVKFVLYPVGGHSPHDPVQIVDVLRRTVDWVEMWSK